jgi:glycosyltransferase involved in cell wall biosynthesis
LHRTRDALDAATLARVRIGFDTTPLATPHPAGIVRVVRETLAALEARRNIEVVRLAPPASGTTGGWRQRALPRAVREQGLVGIHSFLSAFALLGPGRRVHTVHELPWRHGVQENAGLAHRLWAGPLSRRADATVTASARVARELGRKTFEEGGRVHVVPWGVSPAYVEEPAAGIVDEVLLGRWRLPECPLALCMGAVRAKKNLAAVLHGLARLRERKGTALHLVVTGESTRDLRRDLGLAQQLGLARFVSTPGTIPEEDLPGLLRLAAVVPVLSHSEGFALPVLEALACGTPVVVPPDSVQAELAGEHAILVDPRDPDSVADGLESAVARREELRYILPARAREFTWDRTAQKIEAVWEAIA